MAPYFKKHFQWREGIILILRSKDNLVNDSYQEANARFYSRKTNYNLSTKDGLVKLSMLTAFQSKQANWPMRTNKCWLPSRFAFHVLVIKRYTKRISYPYSPLAGTLSYDALSISLKGFIKGATARVETKNLENVERRNVNIFSSGKLK